MIPALVEFYIYMSHLLISRFGQPVNQGPDLEVCFSVNGTVIL